MQWLSKATAYNNNDNDDKIQRKLKRKLLYIYQHIFMFHNQDKHIILGWLYIFSQMHVSTLL
jgi:hypothetical protein